MKKNAKDYALTKNVIAFRRGLFLLGGNENNPTVAATIQAELTNLGFMLDEAAYKKLQATPKRDAIAFYEEVAAWIKATIGDGTYTPLYAGFPQDVMALSDVELFLNTITHYLSGGTFLVNAFTQKRPTAFEHPNYKIITVGTQEDFERIPRDLLSAEQSLAPEDVDVLRWFFANYPADRVQELLPSRIPFKENLCVLVAELKIIPPKMTTTDALRVIVAQSGGDITLKRKGEKIGPFSRAERRELLDMLESIELSPSEMKTRESRWLRVGEVLHPGEYAGRYPKTFAAFQRLRNEKIRTWASAVENAATLDAKLDLLTQRPGEFARRLDALVRGSESISALYRKFNAEERLRRRQARSEARREAIREYEANLRRLRENAEKWLEEEKAKAAAKAAKAQKGEKNAQEETDDETPRGLFDAAYAFVQRLETEESEAKEQRRSSDAYLVREARERERREEEEKKRREEAKREERRRRLEENRRYVADKGYRLPAGWNGDDEKYQRRFDAEIYGREHETQTARIPRPRRRRFRAQAAFQPTPPTPVERLRQLEQRRALYIANWVADRVRWARVSPEARWAAWRQFLEAEQKRCEESRPEIQSLDAPTLDKILTRFESVADKVSLKVLYELYDRFEERREADETRTIFVKGARRPTTLLPLPALDAPIVDRVQAAVVSGIKGRYATLPALETCWIDPQLSRVPLPTNMRTVSESLAPTVRGTRIPIGNQDAKVVRFYVHYEDPEQLVDFLDLSASFVGDEAVDFVSWNCGFNKPHGVHSGDLLRATAGAQYIDIVIEEARKKFNYVVVDVRNWSGRANSVGALKPICGFMEREHPQANEIWKPSTVVNSFKLTSKNRATLAAAFDLRTMEYVVLDVDADCNTASQDLQTTLALLRQYAEPPKVSVADLIRWHIEARGGTEVAEKENAKTVFNALDFTKDYVKILKTMFPNE